MTPDREENVKEAAFGDDMLAVRVSALAREGSSRFLQIGRLLRNFYETIPQGVSKLEALDHVLAGANLSRRTAFTWMEVDKVYGRLKVPEERLAALGWYKLNLMARHITPETAEDWLRIAESNSAFELRTRLRGMDGPRRAVLLELSEADYRLFLNVLVAYGARLHGKKTVRNKEQALMSAFRHLLASGRSARASSRKGDAGHDGHELTTMLVDIRARQDKARLNSCEREETSTSRE
jgi:hypothetical protein